MHREVEEPGHFVREKMFLMFTTDVLNVQIVAEKFKIFFWLDFGHNYD